MCWNRYGQRWEREPERTPEPANTDDLRIADSDRERAVAQLSKHAGDGRLTLDEFEARVADVYTAKTNADLRPVFRGLPSYDDGAGGAAQAFAPATAHRRRGDRASAGDAGVARVGRDRVRCMGVVDRVLDSLAPAGLGPASSLASRRVRAPARPHA